MKNYKPERRYEVELTIPKYEMDRRIFKPATFSLFYNDKSKDIIDFNRAIKDYATCEYKEGPESFLKDCFTADEIKQIQAMFKKQDSRNRLRVEEIKTPIANNQFGNIDPGKNYFSFEGKDYTLPFKIGGRLNGYYDFEKYPIVSDATNMKTMEAKK